MARLFLVRHAPTAETGLRLSGRAPGIGLDDAGRGLAAHLADRFGGGRIDEVVTSPIQRCRETAAAIASAVDRPVRRDRAFIEIDYGSWTGRTFAPLRRTRLWKQLYLFPARVTFPGGENLAQAAHRAVAGCEALVDTRPGGRFVVVSHADILKAIISHYLGQPFDLYQRIVISPASVSVVDIPSHGTPLVLTVNAPGPGGWL